jgi:hypothetical protein
MLNTSFGLREHVIGVIMAQWSSRYKFVGDQADPGSSPESDILVLPAPLCFALDFPFSICIQINHTDELFKHELDIKLYFFVYRMIAKFCFANMD